MRRATVSFDVGLPMFTGAANDADESEPRFDRYVGLLHGWNARSSFAIDDHLVDMDAVCSLVPGRTGTCIRFDTADEYVDAHLELPPVQVGPSYPQPALGEYDACVFRTYFRIPSSADLPRDGVDAVILSLAPTTNNPSPFWGVTRPLLEVALASDGRLIVRHKQIAFGTANQEWVGEGDELPGIHLQGGKAFTLPLEMNRFYCLEAAVAWGGDADKQIAAIRLDGDVMFSECGDRGADSETGRLCAFVGWGRTEGPGVSSSDYSPGSNCRIDFDDCGVNDLQGDDGQNTWLGPGNVRVARPISTEMLGDYYGWARGDTDSVYDGMMNGTSSNVLEPYGLDGPLPPGEVPFPDGYNLWEGLGAGVSDVKSEVGDFPANDWNVVTYGATDYYANVGPGPFPGVPELDTRASRADIAYGLDESVPPGPTPIPSGFRQHFPTPADLGVTGPVALMESALWSEGVGLEGDEPAPAFNEVEDPHELFFYQNPVQAPPTEYWNDPVVTEDLLAPSTGLERYEAIDGTRIFFTKQEALPELDPDEEIVVTLQRHNVRRTYGTNPYEDVTPRQYAAMAVVIDDGYEEQPPLPECGQPVIPTTVAIGPANRGIRRKGRIVGRIA